MKKITARPKFQKRPKKAKAKAPPAAPKEAGPPPARRTVAPPKRQALFCPGPVNLTQHVKNAMGATEICHREPEFTHLLQTIRAKLLHALGLDGRYAAALFSGSGTAALEAAVLSCLDSGKKLLVINNGVYGSRIAQLARIHGLALVEIRSPLTERPDLDRVAAALKRDAQIGTVAMVHHGTSTGMLNPLEQVGALTKKMRRRFLVDAISSVGGEAMDLFKSNVGLCVGSAGKCLQAAPGLAFVLVSQEEASRILKLRPRSLYLDLGLALKSQEAGDPPFTPAIPLYAAFHAALDELIKESLRMRIARYRQRATFLRSGFKKLGLQFLLDEKFISNTLTTCWVPKGVSYQQLHDRLKRAGFVIYAGQSELRNKIFRVAHMGQLLQTDLAGLLKELKETLEAAHPAPA